MAKYYISTDDSSFAEPEEFDSLADALEAFIATFDLSDRSQYSWRRSRSIRHARGLKLTFQTTIERMRQERASRA